MGVTVGRLKDFPLALWRERVVRERKKGIEFRNEDFRWRPLHIEIRVKEIRSKKKISSQLKHNLMIYDLTIEKLGQEFK